MIEFDTRGGSLQEHHAAGLLVLQLVPKTKQSIGDISKIIEINAALLDL
jgi:hypothetical protein